ncbi:MAG: MotA/TolQ/ExbB proton channel family protein [Myxococcota bacterium]
MEVVELFQRGGIIMYAIGIASVAGFAVFTERMWALQRAKVLPRGLMQKVHELLVDDKRQEALLLCEQSRTSIGSVYRSVLRHALDPLPVVKEAAEDSGRREAARLERFVGTLGTVANVGPLLGLLGTVTGMIAVFQRVAETGVGSPLEMAAGIWEALLTTAFGLAVGIPALLAHRFVLARVDALVLELEEEALALLELLRETTEEVPAPGLAPVEDVR